MPRKDLNLLLCKFEKEFQGDSDSIINLVNTRTM
jgi:hypothetical protein